jgi:hypothetical protein
MYRLSIHDVQRRLHEKSEKKLLCYDRVLEICHKRIISSTDREKTNCYFEFPEYIIGFPLFDLNACMEHCKKHLTANGFLVKYHFPNKFYISWDINEIKEHKSLQKRITPLSAMVTQTAITKSPQKIKRDMKLLKNVSTHTLETNKIPPVVGQHVQKQPVHPEQPQQPQQPQQSQQPQQPQQPQQSQQPQQPTKQIMQPLTQSLPTPSVFNTMPFDMYKKITQPLPTTPLKYDPNDIAPQSSVLDNTFFPTNFKQMLSSDIGASQKKTHQRVSNKLSLNI